MTDPTVKPLEVTAETRDPTIVRPWHGADNPMVALHDWAIAEFAKVSNSDAVKALEAKVATLESESAALKAQAQKAAHDLIDVKQTVAAQASDSPVVQTGTVDKPVVNVGTTLAAKYP